MFRALSREEIERIAERLLSQTAARLEALGYRCTVQDGVAAHIAESGYAPVYGARPLRRALQAQVEDVIAEQILGGAYAKGDTVRVPVPDGGIECYKEEKETADL